MARPLTLNEAEHVVLWYRGMWPIFRWLVIALVAVSGLLLIVGSLFDIGMIPRSWFHCLASNMNYVAEASLWFLCCWIIFPWSVSNAFKSAILIKWIAPAIFPVDLNYRQCVRYYSALVPEECINPKAYVYVNEARGTEWFADTEYIAAVEGFYNDWWQQYRAAHAGRRIK